MFPLALVLAIFLASYLLGAIPFGWMIARWHGVDIRQHGSGNIGATNVGRVLGKKYGILVFVLDFLKGALPVAAARFFVPTVDEIPAEALWVAAGIAAFLGHLFPIYLRFRGGKGVATGAGVVSVLAPLPTLAALLTWLIVVWLSRYVSLASILAVIALCIAQALLPPPSWQGPQVIVTIFCVVAAFLVIVRHGSNIRRLLAGTENQLGARGASPGE